MIKAILNWLTGGILDRVLSTVDRKIAADTDREKLKSDIIMEHYRQRSDWMRAGGFLLPSIHETVFCLPSSRVSTTQKVSKSPLRLM